MTSKESIFEDDFFADTSLNSFGKPLAGDSDSHQITKETLDDDIDYLGAARTSLPNSLNETYSEKENTTGSSTRSQKNEPESKALYSTSYSNSTFEKDEINKSAYSINSPPEQVEIQAPLQLWNDEDFPLDKEREETTNSEQILENSQGSGQQLFQNEDPSPVSKEEHLSVSQKSISSGGIDIHLKQKGESYQTQMSKEDSELQFTEEENYLRQQQSKSYSCSVKNESDQDFQIEQEYLQQKEPGVNQEFELWQTYLDNEEKPAIMNSEKDHPQDSNLEPSSESLQKTESQVSFSYSEQETASTPPYMMIPLPPLSKTIYQLSSLAIEIDSSLDNVMTPPEVRLMVGQQTVWNLKAKNTTESLAEACAQQVTCLALARVVYGMTSYETATEMVWLSHIYENRGLWIQAQYHATQALQMISSLGMSKFLNYECLRALYLALGRSDLMLEKYEESLMYLKKADKANQVSQKYSSIAAFKINYNMGEVYYVTKKYADSIHFYQKALECVEEDFSFENITKTSVQINIGLAYLMEESYIDAIQIFTCAYDDSIHRVDANEMNNAVIATYLGLAQGLMNEIVASEGYLSIAEETLSLAEQKNFEFLFQIQKTLILLNCSMENFDKAKLVLARMIQFREQHFSKDIPVLESMKHTYSSSRSPSCKATPPSGNPSKKYHDLMRLFHQVIQHCKIYIPETYPSNYVTKTTLIMLQSWYYFHTKNMEKGLHCWNKAYLVESSRKLNTQKTKKSEHLQMLWNLLATFRSDSRFRLGVEQFLKKNLAIEKEYKKSISQAH